MAGDTAKLLASLDLQDAMSPKLKSAVGNVSAAERGIGSLGGKLSGLSKTLTGGLNSALSTFGGRLKQIATAGLGLLGIGGIFALGKVLTDAIGKARDFGAASLRLSQVTGLNIETTSRLVDALDYFGVSAETQTAIAGLYEKNLAKLTVTSKTAAKFEKDYGLKLRDNKGRLLDYNKQLLVSADYFNNKNIPASQKALALSKLYGKSWQDLIPILAQGRAGILKAEQEAMHLSKADLDAITANKNATRAWDDAIGDLETTIGIKVLPLLTDVMKGLTGFINQHADEITAFFKGAVDFARGIPKFFAEQVMPIINTIKSGWDSLPDGVKDLIVKGLITDRVIKFLFGFSPISTTVTVAEGALSSLIGNMGSVVAAKIGTTLLGSKIVPQHVWVDNPGFGAGGGGAPNLLLAGVAEAAGTAGAVGIGTLAAIGGSAIGLALLPYVIAALLPRKSENFTPNENSTRFIPSRPSFGSAPAIVALKPGTKVGLGETDADMFRSIDDSIKTTNARTAERTEALRQSLAPKLAAIQSATQRQADKREMNRINIAISAVTRISVKDITQSVYTQQTYRTSTTQYQS